MRCRMSDKEEMCQKPSNMYVGASGRWRREELTWIWNGGESAQAHPVQAGEGEA